MASDLYVTKREPLGLICNLNRIPEQNNEALSTDLKQAISLQGQPVWKAAEAVTQYTGIL